MIGFISLSASSFVRGPHNLVQYPALTVNPQTGFSSKCSFKEGRVIIFQRPIHDAMC